VAGSGHPRPPLGVVYSHPFPFRFFFLNFFFEFFFFKKIKFIYLFFNKLTANNHGI
jgi:hypothetical protein